MYGSFVCFVSVSLCECHDVRMLNIPDTPVPGKALTIRVVVILLCRGRSGLTEGSDTVMILLYISHKSRVLLFCFFQISRKFRVRYFFLAGPT